MIVRRIWDTWRALTTTSRDELRLLRDEVKGRGAALGRLGSAADEAAQGRDAGGRG